MENNYFKTAIVLLITLIIGFFIGRSTSSIEKIEHVKADVIIDTIYKEQLKPYASIIPNLPNLPLKKDTVWLDGKPQSILSVDTAQIIKNYITENKYNQTLFNNQTEGLFELDATVQYNELRQLSYKYTPIQKITTIEKKRIFVPFGVVSYSTLNYVGVGGGVFVNDLGISLKYCTDLKIKGYEVSLYYKF